MKAYMVFRLLIIAIFFPVLLSGCDEDYYRGQVLSGKWFGDLGMMVGNQPALGSVIEFIPYNNTYVEGYGNEYDYYRSNWGVKYISHDFTWRIINGVIYLRFDNPDLDCNIRDYSLSYDYFTGYMDGIYSSSYFSLRGYDKYWPQYGYMDNYFNRGILGSDSITPPLLEADTMILRRDVNIK